MDLGLHGKSVLVTAASKGLGKASALEFAREGAKVTLASRSMDSLKTAAAEIEKETGNAVHIVELDITDAYQIEQAVKSAAEFGGGLDVLVTNAGGPPGGTFNNFDDTAWIKAHELNLLSVIRLIRASLPYLREKGQGRIVNLTSTSIKQPIQGLTLSNTYRAAVYGLTKSLSVELANDRILINTVAPGRIATDRIAELDQIRAKTRAIPIEQVQRESIAQIPLGRYGSPDEFGRAVAFLASFANTYITGQALLVDGGMVKAL